MSTPENVRTAIARLRLGRHAKSFVIIDESGFGNTGLFQQLMSVPDTTNICMCVVSVVDGNDFLPLLVEQFRQVLLALCKHEKSVERARDGLSSLCGFTAIHPRARLKNEGAFTDCPPETGLANSGVLESDLAELTCCIGVAAQACGKVVVISIEKLHLVEKPVLSALIAALHQVAQSALPILLVCTGLPILRAKIGDAKPYAERMFDFAELKQ
jgi:hypothetical protein